MLAAAANVLCFPEALTDDVTNAGTVERACRVCG